MGQMVTDAGDAHIITLYSVDSLDGNLHMRREELDRASTPYKREREKKKERLP